MIKTASLENSKRLTHYDLFAGIGGFSLALDEVFNDRPIRHIFCEWEQFPTAVLKQHWPNGEFWGDIAELVTDTKHERLAQRQQSKQGCAQKKDETRVEYRNANAFTIVTGGFPCQPFSAAGRRRGTADDRYKWPEMFQVIRNVEPEWVVAENVRGLVTWNDGMVLEQVCSDLESEGYEVQPFIIPAVAVNAPHRRDRVWVIAHRNSERGSSGHREVQETDGEIYEWHEDAKSSNSDRYATTNTRRKHGSEGDGSSLQSEEQEPSRQERKYPDWKRYWQEVAFATCDDSMDDGLPRLVDGVPQSYAKWRQNSLKAYGNGIVHQIAVEIFKAIKVAEQGIVKV